MVGPDTPGLLALEPLDWRLSTLEAGLRMEILLWKPLLIFWLFLSIGLSLLGFGASGPHCGGRGFTLSASQEESHVGHAGVGILSLRGAPVAMPTFATTAFRRYFGLGRLVRSVLPLGNGRLMHLVVAYGFQGTDDDAEKLSLTDQLFKAPCLIKGISAGLWFDMQGDWARAAGVGPDVTCKRDWACLGGTRRDFVLGCPLAAAALGGCWVDGCCWIQPHLSVCASFVAARWSGKVIQPVRVSPLWPASWVSVVDKTRTSRSAEVRDIWEIYDKCLEFLPIGSAVAIDDALAGRDVHLAWTVWSTAAENAQACAFGMEGGPVPSNGLVLGLGSALFRVENISGNRVRSMCPDLDDLASASEVHLYRSYSIAPFLTLKRRLRAVACLVRSITHNGFTLAGALELDSQWSCIVGSGEHRKRCTRSKRMHWL